YKGEIEVNHELLVRKLTEVLPENQVSTNQNVRELHGKDESYHKTSLPDVVVFPTRTEEVSEIMKIAQAYQVPVVPFGLVTSLEGMLFLTIKGFQSTFL